MRVAVTGGTGVIGRSAVPALIAAGHEVVALARSDAKAAWLESVAAKPVSADMFSVPDLTEAFTGCDAVVNLATSIPAGYAAAFPRSWRANDRLRTEGSRCVLEAARTAGVRRVLQESISFLYADAGDDWISESSPLEITAATEPASVAESHMQDFQCCSRVSVVLRFGSIVGDDAMTRWRLRAARQGRPIGMGDPDGWAHVVHTDDLGPAVVAALSVTSGIYNVGADPVRRRDLVQGFADAAERPTAEFMGPIMRRLAGPRAEPLARSLRVSSQALSDATGWAPARPTFDAGWLEAAVPVLA